MAEIKVNMNDNVKVKLLQKGIDILESKHNWLKSIDSNIPGFELKLDEEGYYKDQLWSLMSDFGTHIGMGTSSVFETNIIMCVDE